MPEGDLQGYQDPQATTRNFNWGNVGNFGMGAAGLGTLGAGAAGLFNSFGQQTQQPFNFPVLGNTPAQQSAKYAGIFGTGGNFNPNALLPTNQTVGSNQAPGATQNLGLPDQTFQQYGQQGGQQQGGQFLSGKRQDQIGNLQSLQSEMQAMQEQITRAEQSGRFDLANDLRKALSKTQNQIQNIQGKLGPYAQGIANGQTPFGDQNAMGSAGLGNLGYGFQNIQNSIGQSNQLIGQGQDLVGQGQQQYQTGAGNLQGLIGQQGNQFQNFFGGLQGQSNQGFGQASNVLNQAGANINAATGFANYSPQTIDQAYGLAGQAGGLAGQVPGDLETARQFALQDRSQRGGLIDQGLNTGLDTTSLGIANQIRQSSLQSAISNITGGAVGDQFRDQVSAAQANAASRGLGINSSPVINAQGQVQKERERLLAEAQNQANLQYQQSLLALRGQQQGNALAGAGLLNQSSMSSQGQLAGLIGAGASAVGAGSGALNAATNAQQTGANIYSQAAQNQIAQGQAMGNLAGQQGQLGTQQGQLLLAGQGQQQGAMQNLINSGLQSNQIGLGGLQGLAGASTAAGGLGVQQGQLGLGTQGQSQDQILAWLQALEQMKQNNQANIIRQGAAGVGASF